MALLNARVISQVNAQVIAWTFASILALSVVGGCAAPPRVPVVDRSVVSDAQAVEYVVAKGDTLYSIAWRFDRDYRQLARLNGIAAPYLLMPGQRVSLNANSTAASPTGRSDPSQGSARTSRSTAGQSTAQQSAPQQSAPQQSSRAPPTKSVTRDATGGSWRWPVSARVTRGYGRGNKGVDFALTPGDDVVAAAGGEVVYAGGGLRGFRRLVIIKHDRRYLSAYSLNHDVLVSEGQTLSGGARLARLTNAVDLHFEIRRDGDPVDPGGVIRRR